MPFGQLVLNDKLFEERNSTNVHEGKIRALEEEIEILKQAAQAGVKDQEKCVGTVQQLQEENKKKIAQIRNLTAEKEAARMRVHELNEMQNNRKSRTPEIESLNEEIAHLKEELANTIADDKIRELQEEIQAFRQAAQSGAKDQEKCMGTVHQLQMENKKNIKQIKTLTAEKEAARMKIQMDEKKIQELNEMLNNRRSRTPEIELLKEEIDRLKQANSRKSVSFMDHQNEAQNMELVHQLEAAEAEKETLIAERDQMMMEKQRGSPPLRQPREDRPRPIDGATDKVNEHTSRGASRMSRPVSINSMPDQNDEQKREIMDMKADIENIKDSLETMHRLQADDRVVLKAVSKEQQIVTLQSRTEALESELNKTNEKCQALRTVLEDVNQQKAEFLSAVSSAEKKITTLRTEKDEAKMTIQMMEKQIHSLNQQLMQESKDPMLQQYVVTTNRLKSEVQRLENILKSKEYRTEQMAIIMQRLQEENRRILDCNRRLNEEVAESQRLRCDPKAKRSCSWNENGSLEEYQRFRNWRNMQQVSQRKYQQSKLDNKSMS